MKKRYLQGNLSKTFGRNSNGTIKYIVIHETDNTAKTGTASNHAKLQLNNSRNASWHYQVDRTEVVQSYTHDVACWHAGKGNRNSIAIELCVDSGFNMKAFNNLLILVQELKKQYPNAKLVQHNYFTGKHCPHNIRERNLWGQVLNGKPTQHEEKEVLTMNQYNELKDLIKSLQNQIVELKTHRDRKLPSTQRADLKKLFKHAFDNGIFTTNHVPNVDNMTHEEALNLLLSYVSRTIA